MSNRDTEAARIASVSRMTGGNGHCSQAARSRAARTVWILWVRATQMAW